MLLQDLGTARRSHRLATGRRWQGAADGWEDPDAGIAVTAAHGPCLDSLSGDPYPWRVTVRWGDAQFTGCGLDLRPSP